MEPRLEDIAREHDLVLVQMGARGLANEMRLLLAPRDGRDPLFVIELQGVLSFYHRATLAAAVDITRDTPGSFGWWLSDHARRKGVTQLELREKGTFDAVLIALARSVLFQHYRGAEDRNFPG
jgi:hypothetical protein